MLIKITILFSVVVFSVVGKRRTNRSTAYPFFSVYVIFFLKEVLDFKCDRMALTNRTNSCVPCSLIL